MLTAAYPKCTPASHQQRRSASRRRNTVSGTAGSSSHFLFWSSVPSLGPLTFLPAFFPSILGRMDALKKKRKKNLGRGRDSSEVQSNSSLAVDLGWIPNSWLSGTLFRINFSLSDTGRTQGCSFWYYGLSYSFSKAHSWLWYGWGPSQLNSNSVTFSVFFSSPSAVIYVCLVVLF